MAGLRPGFGLGGMTHSLLVMEVFGVMAETAMAAAATAWGPPTGLMARGICAKGVADVAELGDAADAGDDAAEAGETASCSGRGLPVAAEIGRAVAMLTAWGGYERTGAVPIRPTAVATSIGSLMSLVMAEKINRYRDVAVRALLWVTGRAGYCWR